MSNELADLLQGDISNGIDFDKVFEKAVEIFADQALLDKKASEVSLKDLEISKAKANNFLDAIGGIMEIGHQVEIMSADKDKFRRTDELKVLNSLRRGCEISSNLLEKNMKLIVKKMEEIENSDDIDPEYVIMLQGMLQSNIDASQKVISSFNRLINLERLSGGRPWGNHKYSGSQVSVVEKLEATTDDKLKDQTAPRQLTWKELQNLE